MKLIINADDWALEPTRDKAIVECFRRGWITQTTAVVNRPGLDVAVALARDEGLLDYIGLHINLMYDRPLTEGLRRCPLFCDAEGFFNGRFHETTKTRLVLPQSVKTLVADEVRAQVRKYKDCGFRLMHADSHQHSHTDFAITPLIVEILKSEGIRTLRIARNLGEGMSLPNRTYKKIFNAYLRRQGIAFTDYFGSIHDFVVSRNQLPKNARVELMCHPMLTKERQDCEDGELTDFYKPFDVELMNGLQLV